MAGTYSQLLLHIVFSTKGRTPWIAPDVAECLYPFMGGIVRAEKGVLYAIGGVEDHVHMYVRWRPDGAVSDLDRAPSNHGRVSGCTRPIRSLLPSAGRRATAFSPSANRKNTV